MNSFLQQYSGRISGTISCFDRVLFKGHLPLGWSEAMERLISRQGLLIKDFKSFVTAQSSRIGKNAEAIAQASGRRFVYLQSRVRKDGLARQIAEEDGITHGLVCVLRRLEPLLSYAMVSGEGRPRLVRSRRQCLCYYFYFIDPVFGFMHARIESWFPLTIQVCLNGHEWLARKLAEAGIDFRKHDNAFLWIEDPAAAQQIADRISRIRWPQTLDRFAVRINPLLGDLLAHMGYYWCTEQAELATDVMFRSAASLSRLYPQLLRHAIQSFGAEDVLTFLGRKMHGRFQGEVLSDLKDKRWPGARIKHRMKGNWIKMYDKFGCVLRVETVINQPKEFKVRRVGVRQGETVMGWFPMRKGVSSFGRYREVGQAANARYLEKLVEVPDRSAAAREWQQLANPVRDANDRSYRGFNPASADDVNLFAAVMRGEHAIQGFRNADVRGQLFDSTDDARETRRRSHRVSRLLKRLHMHKLIAKVPRSTRWRITAKGQRLMKTALIYHHESYPDTLAKLAA